MIKFATLKGKRPKAAGVFSLMLAACLLLFLPGCQGPLDTRQDTARTGTLSVTVEGPPGSQARAILPDGNLVADFDRLIFAFEAGIGNTAAFAPVERDGTLGPVTIDDIPVGSWNLTVTAYLYAPDDDDAEADGHVRKAIYRYDGLLITGNGLDSPSRSLKLNPLGGGEGLFVWYLTPLPEAVTQFTVYIYDFEGWRAGDDYLYRFFGLGYADSQVPLPTGTYWVVFRLAGGGGQALPVGMVLRIYRNMVSSFIEGLDFEPATPVELAINAINTHQNWIPVVQAWFIGDIPSAALQNVLSQAAAVVPAPGPGIGLSLSMDWYDDAPVVGQGGLPAQDLSFIITATSTLDPSDTGSTLIEINVEFLASQAYAAVMVIDNHAWPAMSQEWLDDSEDTADAALAQIGIAVNNFMFGFGTSAVDWVPDAPAPTAAGIPLTIYDIAVSVTGDDGSVLDTNIEVPLTFLADGEVDRTPLLNAITAAETLLGTAPESVDGTEVSMNAWWATAGDRAIFIGAIDVAQAVYDSPGDLDDEDIEAAVAELVGAYTTFYNARQRGTLEIVQARSALQDRIDYAVALNPATYTPSSWAAVETALGVAGDAMGMAVVPDAAVLTALQDALDGLNAAIDALFTLADQQALLDAQAALAQAAVNAISGADTTTEGDIMVAVVAAIDNAIDTDWYIGFNLVPAGPGVPGTITGTIRLEWDGASAYVTVNLSTPALPVDGTFTITWAGFSNPLLAAGIVVIVNNIAGTITLEGYGNLSGFRWYDGMEGLGTGTVLVVDELPPLVTIRVTVEGRTYSLVVDTTGW